ncbi:cupin domain-containing protein [Pseudaestuariivita atlantica]|uniref:Cupin n=1 Tax=Pseudaestuariivita atlantica TaxID=1317121 RepID=A0A0L1JRN1_9RHOB|nr:cupin domain-containing protein [Pseudaestuariivita atlantica]KNG94424.1 cupin [Pseudaestuariivita atlantica]
MKDLVPGPATLEWAGTLYRVVLPASATNGAMSIVDSVSPPLSGPPLHMHHDADETFFVLTGAMDWVCGDRSGRAEAGEAVFIPRGTDHTFRVTADGPSRHLVMLTPGGFEGFFEDMARGQFRIPEDMEAITESAARHHLSFTGPPLGA